MEFYFCFLVDVNLNVFGGIVLRAWILGGRVVLNEWSGRDVFFYFEVCGGEGVRVVFIF